MGCPYVVSYKKLLTTERERLSLWGKNLADYPITSVSPKRAHICATLNKFNLFYMQTYIYVCKAIIIVKEVIQFERE